MRRVSQAAWRWAFGDRASTADSPERAPFTATTHPACSLSPRGPSWSPLRRLGTPSEFSPGSAVRENGDVGDTFGDPGARSPLTAKDESSGGEEDSWQVLESNMQNVAEPQDTDCDAAAGTRDPIEQWSQPPAAAGFEHAGLKHECSPSRETSPPLKQEIPEHREASFRHHVLHVFSCFEARGGRDIGGARSRLRALYSNASAENQRRYPDCLKDCAAVILSQGESCTRESVVDAILDLLVSANIDYGSLGGGEPPGDPFQLLAWLLDVLGGAEGIAAPKSKTARRRGAELLWRLLSPLLGALIAQTAIDGESESGAPRLLHASEATLVRLSRDRIPLVRLAAVRGLVVLRGTDEGSMSAALSRSASEENRIRDYFKQDLFPCISF